jgi:glutamate racemase
MWHMIQLNKRPIGVFDSGVGGLTVARSLRKALPREKIIYFGDTARVPYGNKSKSTIDRFSREIMDFLVEKGVKAVVIACNTASSFSLPFLRNNYELPVIGVISPGIKKAISLTKSGRIGIIGTEATVNSGAYHRVLKRTGGKQYRMFSASCPLFVPLVENRMTSGEITLRVVEKYLTPLKQKRIDTLILGCTHYPMLKKVISECMKGVKLVDSSEAVAEEVRDVLASEDLIVPRNHKTGKMTCYVSDAPDNFKKISGLFLKEKVDVKKAVLR